MLRFDFGGFLTPHENIISTVEEMKIHLVDAFPNTTREYLFDNYVRYSSELKDMLEGNIKQWINGSFTCNQTQSPKDIDLVTFIDYEIIQHFGKILLDFQEHWSERRLGIDSYLVPVYPIGYPQFAYTNGDFGYWHDHFSTTKRNPAGRRHRKGFLEIIY